LLEEAPVNAPTRTALLWTPRALGVGFAAFLALFALDVFDEGQALGPTLAALGMHLLPALVVLAVTILSFRREWIGAGALLGLAAVYAAWAWAHPSWVLAISGPLAVTGLLFLVSWLRHDALREPTTA
jgi:hypothetical protein